MHLDMPAGTGVRFEPGDTREVTLTSYAGDRHVVGLQQTSSTAVSTPSRRGSTRWRGWRRANSRTAAPAIGHDVREEGEEANGHHLAQAVHRPLRPDDRRQGPPGRHEPRHRDREGLQRGPLRRRGRLRRRQDRPRRHGRRPAGDRCHRACSTWSSRTRSSSTRCSASSRATSASRTARSPASASPATRTCRAASIRDSSSAPAPSSSPVSTASPPPAASTPTCTTSRRSRRDAALSNGITTLFGGGTGPTDGTNGVTTTPGVWNLHRMLEAAEAMPVNMGFLGKGNGSLPEALIEQIEAGAAGLKVHEDYGATPAAISNALSVADDYDVQVSVHTDSLNEAGFVEDTISAIDGRTIHTFHTEGAGGGHAPDIIKVAESPQRAAVVDQPDAAVHGQLGRRAARHGDGLPPPVARHPRGRRVRRLARARRDDLRRDRVARRGHHLDVLVRLAGDGPHRRVVHAVRSRSPTTARTSAASCRRTPRATTTSGCCATWPRSPSTRRSPRASRTTSGRSRPGRWPTSCCGRSTRSPPSRGWSSRAA